MMLVNISIRGKNTVKDVRNPESAVCKHIFIAVYIWLHNLTVTLGVN
jgi:hypothetical protein